MARQYIAPGGQFPRFVIESVARQYIAAGPVYVIDTTPAAAPATGNDVFWLKRRRRG